MSIIIGLLQRHIFCKVQNGLQIPPCHFVCFEQTSVESVFRKLYWLCAHLLIGPDLEGIVNRLETKCLK